MYIFSSIDTFDKIDEKKLDDFFSTLGSALIKHF